MPSRYVIAVLMLLALVNPGETAKAEEIRVAVASNFTPAMRDLAALFENQTGHQIVAAFGSTGVHYAQITNGAPFDVFLAADQRRPELLELAGLSVEGTRFTYAQGRIVLWSSHASFVDPGGEVLRSGSFRHLALANPDLAPYGRAAREILMTRSLWEELDGRLVRGQNINQTFQFVATGNAELGFVAYSQIVHLGQQGAGSFWEVPQDLYDPILQQAILLRDTPPAREFLDFVASGAARSVIRRHGYKVSELP